MSCNIDQIPRQKPQSRRLERAPSTCQCKWMGFWFFFLLYHHPTFAFDGRFIECNLAAHLKKKEF